MFPSSSGKRRIRNDGNPKRRRRKNKFFIRNYFAIINSISRYCINFFHTVASIPTQNLHQLNIKNVTDRRKWHCICNWQKFCSCKKVDFDLWSLELLKSYIISHLVSDFFSSSQQCETTTLPS